MLVYTHKEIYTFWRGPHFSQMSSIISYIFATRSQKMYVGQKYTAKKKPAEAGYKRPIFQFYILDDIGKRLDG